MTSRAREPLRAGSRRSPTAPAIAEPPGAAALLEGQLALDTGNHDAAVAAFERALDQVLQLVARGLTNARIAERLFISVKTAGNHVSNVLAKIGVRSWTEAAAFAALHPEALADTD